MEKEINMENKVESEDIEKAEEILFNKWLFEELLDDSVAPTVNPESLVEIMIESKRHNFPVVSLSVGCQQFAEVSGDEGVAVNIVKGLDDGEGSRADRFAESLASLQNALLSWGVKLNLLMTMSDMEGNAFIHNHKSQGIFESESVKSLMEDNSQKMKNLVTKHGGDIAMFSHFEVLKKNIQINSFTDLISRMEFSDGEIPEVIEIHDILWELYEIDPIILTDWVRGETDSPIIWFDLMSPLAGEHREKLQNEIQKSNPEMPILALIKNSGKWETPPEAHQLFHSKEEFVSQILGLKASPKDRENWIRELMSKEDSNLEDFLRMLGISIKVEDVQSKNKSIGILEKIVFGDKEINENGLGIERISVPRNVNLKLLLSEKLNQRRGHISHLIKSGAVRLNDETIDNHFIEVKKGDLLQVGKKVKFMLDIDEG